MAPDLDRRTYDLLRLIRTSGPIGSIRLVELMQQRGYSIKGRTIRLMLSELDERGLTTKVPGRGRALTDAGRGELERGDVTGRLERVRERIATLTSQVTYDPAEDAGEVVAGSGVVPASSIDAAFEALRELADSPLGPVSVATTVEGKSTSEGGGGGDEDERVRLRFPSSITLDGVLLSHGVGARMETAGLVEYRPATDEVVRYIDAISGERSTVDTVSLLIEAGRTDVEAVLAGETGVVIVDNREFPITRFAEARDLSVETTTALGGVLDIRRPRESGPFPYGSPGWEFASLTYGGVAEIALALLHERSLLADWETLDRPVERAEFEPIAAAQAAVEADLRG
ncbi:NrpR regulatory domain-containing protein [Halegenticoccus tardaugens]|uniref:NrpR regulatory domain-containing protein n=1 Tax=Halegenticoccus tardaugens TaxID=2071624 RepID=UPI00100B2FAC|nr:NrpR regulatory domain-containing protein [Halegenticoccus tardaugens]